MLLLSARAIGGADAPQQVDLPSLIVTVIDPADPRLSYMYYRERDSVLAALNNVGFIKVDGGVPSDGEGTLHTITLKRWRRSDAGAAATSQRLKVFLVPETQYGGVDRTALESAIGKSHEGPIYVLGPVLSGSAWSLVAGLKAARGRGVESNGCMVKKRNVTIVSGSASASELRDILGQAATSDGVAVHSTMDLVRGVQSALCEFCGAAAFRFCRPAERASEPTDRESGSTSPDDTSRHDIALFVETSTFYGQSFVNDVRSKLNALVLPFPAGLADRLGEDPFSEKLASTHGEKPSDAATHLNELNIRETSAALDELLRTLAFEDIRTVGVLATDVRDRLVLVQKIRRLLPGVRVILFESDILYSQAPDDVMRGTLVASTYPLFAENQGWTSLPEAESRRETMVSDPAQGAYNATLLLLGDMEDDMGGGLGFDAGARLVEYRSPAFAADMSPKTPPVWISVIGARGSWPVAIANVDATDGGTGGIAPRDVASSDFASLDFPHPHLTSANVEIRFADTPSAGITLAKATLASGTRTYTPAAELTPPDAGPAERPAFITQQEQQALSPRWLKPAPTPFQGLVVLTVLAAAGLAAWLWRRPHPSSLVWPTVVGATSLVLVFEGVLLHPPVALSGMEHVPILSFAAIGLAFVMPTVSGWRCAADPRPLWWEACAALLLTGLLVVALAAMMMGFSRMEPGRLAPFFVRATHLESGLSPVPPLLLVYLTVMVGFFSIVSMRKLDPGFPSKMPGGRGLRLVVFGAFLVLGWYLRNQFRPMLEPAPLGAIFRAVYVLAPLALIWSFMVALQTAGTLRQALDRIAQEKDWPKGYTLGGRHLVLARAGSDGWPPFRPGDSPKDVFSPVVVFLRTCKTAVAVRQWLVLPLFVTPLLVLGLATYPFEPRGLLILTYGIMLTVFVLGTVIYVVQIENHRGAALLRDGSTETRALDLGLLMRVTLAVIPALLTLIGAGLPSTGQKIFGWVDQVLTMFK